MDKIKCEHCGEMVDKLYKSSNWICVDCLIGFLGSFAIRYAKDEVEKVIPVYKNYRMLSKGEIVLGTDEYDYGNGWEPIEDNCCACGKPAYADNIYRRGYNH